MSNKILFVLFFIEALALALCLDIKRVEDSESLGIRIKRVYCMLDRFSCVNSCRYQGCGTGDCDDYGICRCLSCGYNPR
uniref:Uncharacterized protein n=1 Tax=Acrobeloides nanus TaxID=290746 RepID=A0A914E6Q2_9BILA